MSMWKRANTCCLDLKTTDGLEMVPTRKTQESISRFHSYSYVCGVCIHMFVWVHECKCTCTGDRGQWWVCPLSRPFLLKTGSLHWTRRHLIQVGWLANDRLGCTCLLLSPSNIPLPSAGATDAPQVWLFTWVLRTGNEDLKLVQYSLYFDFCY